MCKTTLEPFQGLLGCSRVILVESGGILRPMVSYLGWSLSSTENYHRPVT